MAKSKVSVPYDTGEIVVNRAGEETTYRITDGTVSVDAADLDHFLAVVDGSTESAKPAAPKKES